MLGAIVGDIIGSVYEFAPVKTKDFPLLTDRSHITDDTLLTIAVAACLIDGAPLVPMFRFMVAEHPSAGWGGMFRRWALSGETHPYNSFGNGSAMRVSPVGFAFDSVDEVLRRAEWTAAVTHDHPEGVKGAQATALAVFLARKGADKAEIRRAIESRFEYDLSRTVDEIRPTYGFDETCQGTVPEAIVSFLDSTSLEDAVRNAVSLGGDADTLAAIAGPIAQAHYQGVPGDLRAAARARLAPDLWEVVEGFEARFGAA